MEISFLVSTRDRCEVILGCLDAIKASLGREIGRTEIVVVDNGSKDRTSAVVREWSAGNTDVRLLLIHEPAPGLSRARNAALRASSGKLLVFTDDDCRLGPDYVREARALFAADRTPTIRGGLVRLGDPADLPITINETQQLVRYCKAEASARSQIVSDIIPGCNMAMTREVAELIGEFDVNLGAGTPLRAGEDADYLCRAYLAGVTLEHVPAMLVYHFHGRRRSEDARHLMEGYMISHGALCAKYLFKHARFLLPAYWDTKNFAKSLFSKQQTGIPDLGLTGGDLIRLRLKGAAEYLKVAMGVSR